MADILKTVELANFIGNLPIAVEKLKEIIKDKPKLSAEEKEIFSATFKNVIGEKKDMRSQLAGIIDDKTTSAVDKKVAETLKKEVETEIKKNCEEVIVSLGLNSYKSQ